MSYTSIEQEQVSSVIQDAFSIQLLPTDDLRSALALEINRLINKDFNLLISILYRLDISEAKIKQDLKSHPEKDAGELIAGLVLSREHEKIRTRSLFNRQADAPGEEKW